MGEEVRLIQVNLLLADGGRIGPGSRAVRKCSGAF